MASYCLRRNSSLSTFTVASPARQMKLVSLSPFLKETEGVEAFRIMRPYVRCLLVLLLGETEMLRPVFALVWRKTIRSIAGSVCVLIIFISPLRLNKRSCLGRRAPYGSKFLIHKRHRRLPSEY